jgi:2-oxoglutarate dehydrogenase E1 component
LFEQMLSNSYLFGANAPFIEQLYESYLQNPASVDARWRDYFAELERLDQGPKDVAHTPI